jgi:hypothetical protein
MTAGNAFHFVRFFEWEVPVISAKSKRVNIVRTISAATVSPSLTGSLQHSRANKRRVKKL